MPKDLSDKIVISPLMRSMVGACAALLQTAPDPWSARTVEALLDNLNQWCFVALLNGDPVGFACFLVLGENADLQQLAVQPALRRQGVGNHLLVRCLTELKRQGVTRCLLEVRASNTGAVALYEQFGFRRMAVRPGMYQNPAEDGYLMGLNLGKR